MKLQWQAPEPQIYQRALSANRRTGRVIAMHHLMEMRGSSVIFPPQDDMVLANTRQRPVENKRRFGHCDAMMTLEDMETDMESNMGRSHEIVLAGSCFCNSPQVMISVQDLSGERHKEGKNTYMLPIKQVLFAFSSLITHIIIVTATIDQQVSQANKRCPWNQERTKQCMQMRLRGRHFYVVLISNLSRSRYSIVYVRCHVCRAYTKNLY